MYYKEGCATLQTKPQKQVLGILGGLGPAASCYLYQMLIDHTPATCDQDHIDIVISSRASTPDRTAFIMGKSKDDPFAVMEQDGFSLVHYGATVLAIPCNTAHYFYDRLAEALPVPVLNMPRLTVADAKAAGCTKLGILATDGTLAAETYQLACQAQGIDWAVPSEEHQQEVMSVIYDDIKQGKRADMAKFGAAVHDLKKQGCDMAVLGCTELSLVKRDEHLGKFFIDSTEVLCRHALEACGVKPIGFSPYRGKCPGKRVTAANRQNPSGHRCARPPPRKGEACGASGTPPPTRHVINVKSTPHRFVYIRREITDGSEKILHYNADLLSQR